MYTATIKSTRLSATPRLSSTLYAPYDVECGLQLPSAYLPVASRAVRCSALFTKTMQKRSRVVQTRAAHVPYQLVSTLAEVAERTGEVEAPAWVLPAAALVIGIGFTAFVTLGLKPGADAQEEMAARSAKGWNAPLKKSGGSAPPPSKTAGKSKK